MTLIEAVIAGDAAMVAEILPNVSDNTLNVVYKGTDGSYTVLDKARALTGSKGKRIVKMLMERNAKSARVLSRKSKGGRPAKSRKNRQV